MALLPMAEKVLNCLNGGFERENPWKILYPLVVTNIAIENDHRNSGFTH